MGKSGGVECISTRWSHQLPYLTLSHLCKRFIVRFGGLTLEYTSGCKRIMQSFRSIPGYVSKITELRENFKNITKMIKPHVFADFSRYCLLVLSTLFYILE